MKLNLKVLLPLAAVTITAAVLAVSCGSKYSYESVKGDPLKARIYTLDNGLKVYMTVNKEMPRIQTYIAVRVGGKNDPAETTGLAHYFEHLMFKGTEQFGTQDYTSEKALLDQIEQQFEVYRRTADEGERRAIYKVIDSLSYAASGYSIPNEYDKLMSAIGAEGTNAYTGYDMTVYVEDIPSNQIENWARIQADRFRNNVIRGFHTELETVYEEKNMSLTSDGRKVYEAMLTALFPNHPYGTQTVLGTQDHLKNPSITNIKNYYKEWYVPNNMAICLSGDFNPDQMMDVIVKYFGDMEANPNLKHLEIKEEAPIAAPVAVEVLGLDAENVNLAWRCGSISSEDADKLNILSSVLYNGKAGLIDLDLIQQQKILSGYGYYNGFADHGVMVMSGRPKAGQTLDEVKDLMLAEVAKLRAGDFDENLLTATINNIKVSMMQYLDSNDGRADAFVQSFINGIDWKDEVEAIDRMSKVTKQDIVELANRVLGDNNYVVIYKREGKDPNEAKIDKPEITPIQMNRDAVSDFLKEVQTAQVSPIEPVFLDYNKDLGKTKVKSDIEVLYSKNPTNDLFELYYLFETGSNNDPALNTAFNYLNYLGTSQYTPEQIKQEFYNIACSYSVHSNPERSWAVVHGLNENMPRAMELMESLLADAQPNEAALENLKADILKRRVDNKLNQSYNFSMLRSYMVYGSKSPATNVLSTQEVMALTSEDLLARVRSLSGMEHDMLYYGPLSGNELTEVINKYHNVPEKLTPVPALVEYPILKTPETKVYLAEYDAKQIYYLQYSNRGEIYDVANEPGMTMYNEYFGGGMNSIVFQEMREARALAYSSSAYLSPATYKKGAPYAMIAFIATQNDKMIDAVNAFEEIINNMPESEAAFNLAKDGIISRLRTERIIKADIIWNYIGARDMGVDHDSRREVFEQVQNMTLEDVKAFQQKWVKDRTYVFGVLGHEADLDVKKLGEYGPVTRVSQEELFGY